MADGSRAAERDVLAILRFALAAILGDELRQGHELGDAKARRTRWYLGPLAEEGPR